jgi:tetratricopeptide (TPR) repeat protein
MQIGLFLNKIVSALSLSSEVWMSLLLGAALTLLIAYIIYRIQKKESIIHKQDHDAKLDRIEQLHLQDSEKIKVLYELIIRSQRGSIGELESAVLEQKIEVAAEQITKEDSDKAQVLKAIAEKDKSEADDLLAKIAQKEHDLVEMYNLHAMNENRNGIYSEAVKWYRKIVELEPDNFVMQIYLIDNLIKADQKTEAQQLALSKLEKLEQAGEADLGKLWSLYDVIVRSYPNNVYDKQREKYLEKLIDLIRQHYGEQSYEMLCVLNEQALAYNPIRTIKDNEEIYKKCLSIIESGNIPEDKIVCMIHNNLAQLYTDQGRYKEALPLLEKTRQDLTRLLDPEHPYMIITLNNVANVLSFQGNHREAEALYLKVIDLAARKLGTEHEYYMLFKANLADMYNNLKRHDEADAIYSEILKTAIHKYGEDSYPTGNYLRKMGNICLGAKKFDDAVFYFKKALDIYRKVLDEEHPSLVMLLAEMAVLNSSRGNLAEAEQEGLQIIKIYEKTGQETTKKMAIAKTNLGMVYYKQERYTEAEYIQKQAVDFFLQNQPDTPNCASVLDRYSMSLAKLERLEEAEACKTKAEELRAKISSENKE